MTRLIEDAWIRLAVLAQILGQCQREALIRLRKPSRMRHVREEQTSGTALRGPQGGRMPDGACWGKISCLNICKYQRAYLDRVDLRVHIESQLKVVGLAERTDTRDVLELLAILVNVLDIKQILKQHL